VACHTALAARVIQPFVGAAIAFTLAGCAATPTGFGHPAVVPLIQLTPVCRAGTVPRPDASFKDMALQLLGRLFDQTCGARCARRSSSTGDTGSADRGRRRSRPNRHAFLHPHDRISAVPSDDHGCRAERSK
jgi:threonine synthase